MVLVLWFGARLVVEGKLTPGELSTFIIYAIYVGGEVGSIASVISSLVQVKGAGWPHLSCQHLSHVSEAISC